MGLVTYDDPESVGYTMFSPLSDENTYLIDQCGYLIHTWHGASEPGELSYLLDDGSILRQERQISEIFAGGGIGGVFSRISWDGELLWSFNIANDSLHAHHDMAILPNGNIATVAWEYHSEAEAIALGKDPETFAEAIFCPAIVEFEPVGTDTVNFVWKWSMWDHLIQDFDETKGNYGVVADHPELMNINFPDLGTGNNSDWMHCNAIDYNAELDQFVMSSRLTSEIFIVDHSTTTEEAASHEGGVYGKGGDFLYRFGNPQAYNRGTQDDQMFVGQHDSRWTPPGFQWEGTISVFNNAGGGPGMSSVDFFLPPQDSAGFYTDPGLDAYGPSEMIWSWTQPEFYSSFISGAHKLENGNVLVCEGASGTFFEVDTTGTVVWEYINPVGTNGPMTQGNIPSLNAVFRATRIQLDHPGLEGKDLTPGLPIEFGPLDYDCTMMVDTMVPPDTSGVDTIDLFPLGLDDSVKDSLITSVSTLVRPKPFLVYPNPFSDYLTIAGSGPFEVEVRNTTGALVLKSRKIGYTRIDPSSWPTGLYLLILKKEDQIQIEKILKS